MNYNKVIQAGNLTRDIELRSTQGGQSVGKFGLAVNRKWYKDGEKQESTCFVDCVVWGRQAEVMAEHLSKGSNVLIEGRLEFSQWEDKNGGGKRSKLEVVVERFEFVGGKDQTEKPARATKASEPDEYEDVPF